MAKNFANQWGISGNWPEHMRKHLHIAKDGSRWWFSYDNRDNLWHYIADEYDGPASAADVEWGAHTDIRFGTCKTNEEIAAAIEDKILEWEDVQWTE